jgi:hypothetical protein
MGEPRPRQLSMSQTRFTPKQFGSYPQMVRLISRLGSEDLILQSRRKQIISVASIGKKLSQEGFLGAAAGRRLQGMKKRGL